MECVYWFYWSWNHCSYNYLVEIYLSNSFGCRSIANRYLRTQQNVHVVDQSVEWLYAFDIHCNSFFPVFVLLYVAQFFFLPGLMSSSFIATFIANTMYLVALVNYYYITFLGFNGTDFNNSKLLALPFLQKQTVFLYPVIIIVILYIISLILGFNVSKFLMNMYFG